MKPGLKWFDKKLRDDKIPFRIRRNSMEKIEEQIRGIASQYALQIIYIFGSRAKEALDLCDGRIEQFSSTRCYFLKCCFYVFLPPSIFRVVINGTNSGF
jgi:hypothetical protein